MGVPIQTYRAAIGMFNCIKVKDKKSAADSVRKRKTWIWLKLAMPYFS